MIPDEAIEAARRVMSRGAYQMTNDELPYAHVARAAIEAAEPIMRQAFFLEMNLRAVEDEINTPLQLSKARHGND